MGVTRTECRSTKDKVPTGSLLEGNNRTDILSCWLELQAVSKWSLEGRSTIAGTEERSTEKERNDSGEVEKPCRVMEPERAFHTWGGWGETGPEMRGYGAARVGKGRWGVDTGGRESGGGYGADMGWWGPPQPASASMKT